MIMLVRVLVRSFTMQVGAQSDLPFQLNTLGEPADLAFNLTESPWLRAGRQYSVRVRVIHSRDRTNDM